MHKAGKLFFNRYVVVLFLFAGWMLLFDDNNIFRQIKLKNELKSLREQLQATKQELLQDSLFLEELKTNPALKEKIAREKYLMKKDDEIVFSVVRENIPDTLPVK